MKKISIQLIFGVFFVLFGYGHTLGDGPITTNIHPIYKSIYGLLLKIFGYKYFIIACYVFGGLLLILGLKNLVKYINDWYHSRI